MYSYWRKKGKPRESTVTKGSCGFRDDPIRTSDNKTVHERVQSVRVSDNFGLAENLKYKLATKGRQLGLSVRPALQYAMGGMRRIASSIIRSFYSFSGSIQSMFLPKFIYFNNPSSFSAGLLSSLGEHNLQVVVYDEFDAMVNSGECEYIDISATYIYIQERSIIYQASSEYSDDPDGPLGEIIAQMEESYYELVQ